MQYQMCYLWTNSCDTTRKGILLLNLMHISSITLMSMPMMSVVIDLMMWLGWMNVAGVNMGHVLGPGAVKVWGLGSSLLTLLPSYLWKWRFSQTYCAGNSFVQGELYAILVHKCCKLSPWRVSLSYQVMSCHVRLDSLADIWPLRWLICPKSISQ